MQQIQHKRKIRLSGKEASILATKIVTASGKGGVGKSTICKGLGIALAESGFRALLVDCDAGLSSLDIMLGVTESVNFSWHDIILEQCEPGDALIEISENLSLLPSPSSVLYDISDEDFKAAIECFDESFDFIILDAPAGIGTGLKRASAAATKSLVVATADEVSVKGAAKVAKTLSDTGINENRLIINRYDLKAAKKGKLLTIDDIIDKTVVQLIGIIPEEKNILYSTVSEKKLKTKRSDNAFLRVAGRISGHNVDLNISQLK